MQPYCNTKGSHEYLRTYFIISKLFPSRVREHDYGLCTYVSHVHVCASLLYPQSTYSIVRKRYHPFIWFTRIFYAYTLIKPTHIIRNVWYRSCSPNEEKNTITVCAPMCLTCAFTVCFYARRERIRIVRKRYQSVNIPRRATFCEFFQEYSPTQWTGGLHHHERLYIIFQFTLDSQHDEGSTTNSLLHRSAWLPTNVSLCHERLSHDNAWCTAWARWFSWGLQVEIVSTDSGFYCQKFGQGLGYHPEATKSNTVMMAFYHYDDHLATV